MPEKLPTPKRSLKELEKDELKKIRGETGINIYCVLTRNMI